jgi:hypothetical protein
MVQAKQVQHGGVEVVNVHRFFDRSPAEIVRATDDRSVTNASAGQQGRECQRVMIATVVALTQPSRCRFTLRGTP